MCRHWRVRAAEGTLLAGVLAGVDVDVGEELRRVGIVMREREAMFPGQVLVLDHEG